MAIITFAHQKGGVGKTTLAINVCAYFQSQGARVAAVDADPQGSLTHLQATMKEHPDFNLVPVYPFVSYLKNVGESDLVVIDTPPYLSNLLPEIFDHSDLVVIPTQASPLDALAIGASVGLVKEARLRRPALKAAIVLNRTDSRTTFVDDVATILQRHDLPILKTRISSRIAYQRATLTYGNVLDSDDQRAHTEIESLANELIALLAS